MNTIVPPFRVVNPEKDDYWHVGELLCRYLSLADVSPAAKRTILANLAGHTRSLNQTLPDEDWFLVRTSAGDLAVKDAGAWSGRYAKVYLRELADKGYITPDGTYRGSAQYVITADDFHRVSAAKKLTCPNSRLQAIRPSPALSEFVRRGDWEVYQPRELFVRLHIFSMQPDYDDYLQSTATDLLDIRPTADSLGVSPATVLRVRDDLAAISRDARRALLRKSIPVIQIPDDTQQPLEEKEAAYA